VLITNTTSWMSAGVDGFVAVSIRTSHWWRLRLRRGRLVCEVGKVGRWPSQRSIYHVVDIEVAQALLVGRVSASGVDTRFHAATDSVDDAISRCSNSTGVRYPRAEWRRRRLKYESHSNSSSRACDFDVQLRPCSHSLLSPWKNDSARALVCPEDDCEVAM